MTFRSKPAMGYSPPSNPRRRGWQLRALSRLTGRCTASKFDKSEWRSGIDTAAALPPSLDSGDGSAGSTPIPKQESDVAELIRLVAHPDLVALQVGADPCVASGAHLVAGDDGALGKPDLDGHRSAPSDTSTSTPAA